MDKLSSYTKDLARVVKATDLTTLEGFGLGYDQMASAVFGIMLERGDLEDAAGFDKFLDNVMEEMESQGKNSDVQSLAEVVLEQL